MPVFQAMLLLSRAGKVGKSAGTGGESRPFVHQCPDV